MENTNLEYNKGIKLGKVDFNRDDNEVGKKEWYITDENMKDEAIDFFKGLMNARKKTLIEWYKVGAVCQLEKETVKRTHLANAIQGHFPGINADQSSKAMTLYNNWEKIWEWLFKSKDAKKWKESGDVKNVVTAYNKSLKKSDEKRRETDEVFDAKLKAEEKKQAENKANSAVKTLPDRVHQISKEVLSTHENVTSLNDLKFMAEKMQMALTELNLTIIEKEQPYENVA